MKKTTIIAAVAAVAASIAALFVRRKISSRTRKDRAPVAEPLGRHETNAFVKAKVESIGKKGRPKSAKSRHS